jgi:hypothetical protein
MLVLDDLGIDYAVRTATLRAYCHLALILPPPADLPEPPEDHHPSRHLRRVLGEVRRPHEDVLGVRINRVAVDVDRPSLHQPPGAEDAQTPAAQRPRWVLLGPPTDLSELDQLEPECLNLPHDTEHFRLILQQTGEHRIASLHLGGHRGKRGQGGRPEPTLDRDLVHGWECCHTIIVVRNLVNPRRRNLVIALPGSHIGPRMRAERPVDRSRNSRPR